LIRALARPSPSPSSPPPHHLGLSLWIVHRSQRWISMMASRSCVYKLALDSDGDHVLFSPIFCRTPMSRYIDCYSLAKISEILVGAHILVTPIFVTFSAWRAGTTSWYSAGESPPIKAGRPEATPHLVSACGELNTFWKTYEIFSARSGRSHML
jgi:hypothetical protein